MRRRALALVVAGALALAAAELGARLVLLPRYWRPLPPFGALTNERQRDWLARQRAALAAGRDPDAESIGRFDARLGWVPRAGSASRDGTVTIGARGFRGGREYAATRPEGTLRLACFGDSFTFCEEVADGETWQAHLEARDPRVEALNLGVGGYGTDQALLRARDELPGLDADLVVVGLLLENVGRNVNRYRPLWYPNAESPVAKPRFVLAGGELALVPTPFAERRALLEAVASGAVLDLLAAHEFWSERHVPPGLGGSALARLLGARGAYAARDLPRLWSDVEGEPFRVSLALLAAFRDLAAECGASGMLVLVFPIRADLERFEAGGEPYWATLTSALEGLGLPFVDLAPPLAAARRDGTAVYRRSHLSPAGNAVVAEGLGARLPAPGAPPGTGFRSPESR